MSDVPIIRERDFRLRWAPLPVIPAYVFENIPSKRIKVCALRLSRSASASADLIRPNRRTRCAFWAYRDLIKEVSEGR
jgi:hypothetical protein